MTKILKLMDVNNKKIIKKKKLILKGDDTVMEKYNKSSPIINIQLLLTK